MILTLAHWGLNVVVEASEADCHWLAGFLQPAFTVALPGAVATGTAHVRLEYVPAAVDGPDAAGARVAFAFDASPTRLPEHPHAGGARLHDRALGVTYDVTHDGRRATVLVPDSARRSARLALMRVVREYAHNHSVARGGVVLHAAAVATSRGAVAIAGPKHAGKTTLLLRMLASPAIRYLSNDRLLVSPDDGIARAVPTVVALRAGTRTLLPDVIPRLAAAGDFRATAPDRTTLEPPAALRDVWYFSPSQVSSALNRTMEAAAPLVAVLLLFPDGADRPVLRRLSAEAAGPALLESVLCHRSGQYVSDVFTATPSHGLDMREVSSRCEALASRVACVAVSGAHTAGPDDADQMLATCLP